jgi:hypothetical protein
MKAQSEAARRNSMSRRKPPPPLHLISGRDRPHGCNARGRDK